MHVTMQTFTAEDLVIVRLDPGDLALESIRDAIDDHDVDTGVVLSGIGTFRNLHVHYLHTTDLEDRPRNTFLEREGAWEVNAIQGVIADGEPHLHVTAFDGEETIAGHLEEGNEINALGEVVIRRVEDLDLERRPNEFEVAMLEER
jgi:predicted DNA-binding protein with PD1-like motif